MHIMQKSRRGLKLSTAAFLHNVDTLCEVVIRVFLGYFGGFLCLVGVVVV